MRHILFVTSTRADFGKLQPLIEATSKLDEFSVTVFVTGMHMLRDYGETHLEVKKKKYKNTYYYVNQGNGDSPDTVVYKTMMGLSAYLDEFKFDLVIVHGDRVEAIAVSLTCALKNIKVGHVEGGEFSGTIDNSIRHATTKFSHSHFVANDDCKARLIKLGENPNSIFCIGSPEIDLIQSKKAPKLEDAKLTYGIDFDNYYIGIFHSVVTETHLLKQQIEKFVNEIISSSKNFIIIYPNNDLGSELIKKEYTRLVGLENIRIFPSIRFEYYLIFLKNARAIIGNSSSGVREAPVFGIPSIDIGSRQNKRSNAPSIFHTMGNEYSLSKILTSFENKVFKSTQIFGSGNSGRKFRQILLTKEFWEIPIQKSFFDQNDN